MCNKQEGAAQFGFPISVANGWDIEKDIGARVDSQPFGIGLHTALAVDNTVCPATIRREDSFWTGTEQV
jgi:hypothetical protein